MNEVIQNVLMKLEPQYEVFNFKKSGEKVDENIEMELSTGRKIVMKSVLDQAPLLLVFIKGTWCPFCRLHLQKLRNWAEKLKNKTTIVVVSSEPKENINHWLKTNNVSYLFVTDPEGSLGKEFGVWVKNMDFSQASTFLVERGGLIRTSFVNRRDENHQLEQFIS